MNPTLCATPSLPERKAEETGAVGPTGLDLFTRELSALKQRATASMSMADFRHMRRLELIGRCCTLLGFATAWIVINPISVVLIAMGMLTRWLLAHHICHGGYDGIEGIPARYTSRVFARGWRRFVDWFDWMHPDAWRYEHDFLHHYYTGEDRDPDLVERNAILLRKIRVPKILKYITLFVVAITWKFSYYAANTLNGLEGKKHFRDLTGHHNFINLANFCDLRMPLVRKLWFSCWLPNVAFHFLLVPALFLPLGKEAWLSVLVCRIAAELLHNLHMFVIIVTNHAGDDVMRFDFHYTDKKNFYVNQVLGSVNFHTGKEWLDFSQMWLNYQIEHHLFPRLSMLKYREIQPEVKALCERHGVTYIQENVFRRLRKLTDICVGNTSMPRMDRPGNG